MMDVEFSSDSPKKLATQLREAINASELFDEFKHFYQLKRLYRFKELPNGVKAEFIQVRAGVVGHQNHTGDPDDPTSSDSVDSSPLNVRSIPEAQDLIDILASASSLSDQTELRFPNAVLFDTNRITLHDWSQENGWTYIDQGSNGVTLTKKAVPSGIAWEPPNGQDS
jgi:hypothetical protein